MTSPVKLPPLADERISDDTLWSWAEQIMGSKEAHHVGRDRVLRYGRLLLSSTTARDARAWEIIDDAMGKTYITESVNLVTTLSKEPDVKINPLAYAALASAPIKESSNGEPS